MPERKGSFNVFGVPTLRDVKVGYISTERGYVSGVGLWDANVYAKKNPGTTFIFNNREGTRYLNINEVNKLTVNDLPQGNDPCSGVEIFKKDSEDKDPKIIFSGGGGVGAQANPVIGQDGSLLGIHLISGGFGYKYPPQVSIEDPTGYAAGAVIRCGIGSTVTSYQTYEDEEDFENYFPPHVMKLAPPKVGFGDQFIGGKKIGSWNPYKYIDSQETPFEQTVKNYMKEVRAVQSPWWTTHEAPNKVIGDNKTTKTFYKVKHGVWGEFLNSYAISPVPMSRSKGSDFPGRWYTFEWEDVEFPYDGEYKFRAQCDNDARFFLDNQAVSEFKIGEGGAAGSVLSNPLNFKETISKGKHNLKLELYNHPIMEDVTVQGDEISTRQEVQVAGGDFILKSNGYHLAVGGNEETELVLTLEYNDNPRTAGTAVTKVTIPNPNGPDLVLEREKDSNGNFKTRGSVSAKGVFKRSESGYGPFIVEGNSGSTKLVRQNLTYGVNSVKYGQIDFLDSHGSDINGSLKLISAKNLQESRTVLEAPISSESTKLKTVFNTVDYINKANRKLWRINAGSGQGFINDYGICPFDTTVILPDNPYAGTHEIRWNSVNFPVSGNYIIEIQVDDNVNLRIGNEVEIRKEGFTIVNGRYKGTGKLREVHYIKEGTYNIFAGLEQIPGGKFGFGKGLNPMALAINITTAFTEEQRVKKVDWHYNPMGVAMIIEAPAPPIPQQPKPVQQGRCPANPFWTTRFAGGTTQWHPVFVEGWGKFLNKYAMSPVPPYDTDSTSGGGISFENEWTVNIPYDGFYKLKGSADDNSKFWIDDKLELETKRSGKVQDETMVFLSEGTSKIRVAVENYLFEEKNLIDQKIFNTADWANAGSGTGSKTQSVDFKVTTNSSLVNSIDIKGLFYEQGPKLVSAEETPPPQVKPAIDAGVNFIKKGDQYFMTVTGNDLIEVTFDFRYHEDDVNIGGGLSVRGITIQTEGAPLTFRRTDGPRMLLDGWPGRGGSVVKKATFKKGKEYPISFTGRLPGAADPEVFPFGSLDNASQEIPNRRINFFDTDTSGGATTGADSFGDTRAHFTATNVKQLSDPAVETFAPEVKTKLRQLDGGSNIIREVEIGKEYIVEIKNAGVGLWPANYVAPPNKLKADGGVLMVEDIPSVPAEQQGGVLFDDLVCTASHGRFYDIKGSICKFKVDSSNASVKVQKDEVTYNGPKLYRYAYKGYGQFMKKSGVAPDYPVGGSGQVVNYVWSNVDFPADDTYKFLFAHDAHGSVYLDGKEIIIGDFDTIAGVSPRDEANWKTGITKSIKVTKGKHVLAVAPSFGRLGETNINADGLFKKLSPDYYRGQQAWNNNPSGMALSITRRVDVNVLAGRKPKHKSWAENPVGVSGILIPPPCPEVVGGAGVVDDVRPIVPGNGFTPPTGPGYPVGLKLKRIDIDTPGINYNPDDPVKIDGPGEAHICEMDSYGRIKKICLDDDADDGSKVGITDYPYISIDSPTGSGFRGIPIVEIVPDPVDPTIDRDKLLQVTDLVGVNQTGYYDGRAYYGAIFYKDGVKYAGYYETAGQLVQIYDTLQESIDAQVTTPASAILRQGTDISSDNPRLDIPGTPDNLT